MSELKPEAWGFHLLGLLSPLIVISGNIIGGFYTSMGVIFIWGIAPILDIILGETKNPRPPRESGLPFEILLWTHGISHFIVMGSFFYFASDEGWTFWLITASLSTGLCASTSATVTAHELGHKRPKSLGWRLSRILLFSVNYSHFTTEHNHNHHKWVSTDKDPASATVEQSLWAFWIKTIPRQYISSVKIHNKKGRRGINNPSYQGLLLNILTFLILIIVPSRLDWFDGRPMAFGWALLSLISILTLEYVNYIRHWGLRRSEGEKFRAIHAWNTEARWSRWSLIELTRHSDHHLRASVPFWELRPHVNTPTLPFGYYACWWPCVISPIWKSMMTKRIPLKLT